MAQLGGLVPEPCFSSLWSRISDACVVMSFLRVWSQGKGHPLSSALGHAISSCANLSGFSFLVYLRVGASTTAQQCGVTSLPARHEFLRSQIDSVP